MPLFFMVIQAEMQMKLIDYAKSFIGTRYKWGANGGGAFDCSGFVQEILASQGFDPDGDQTAQQLYDKLGAMGYKNQILTNSVLFFGESSRKITHCAFHIGNSLMIEAAGGGSNTDSESDSIRDAGMVRIRPILSRMDLIGGIYIPEKGIYSGV